MANTIMAKKGQKVKVVDRLSSGHEFEIGTLVTCSYTDKHGGRVCNFRSPDGVDCYYMWPEEYEIIE